jgi:hypothetical protein
MIPDRLAERCLLGNRLGSSVDNLILNNLLECHLLSGILHTVDYF